MAANAAGEEYRYEKHSWPEINDAVAEGKAVIVPTACIEDHGKHLPIDVDIEITTAICEATAASREDVLLFPTVDNGYDPHHMHFPGTVAIGWETFVDGLIDVGISLAHHGFEEILFVNGHGSNHHLVKQATRQVMLQYPDVRCAMLSWWQISEVADVMAERGEGGPGGSAHAGELETSVYMHLHPDDVDMDEAVREIPYPESDHFYGGFPLYGEGNDATAVTMMEWWSKLSESGVWGDATVATPEKGEAILEAAVDGLNSVLDDFRSLPPRETADHHSTPREGRDFDPFRPR